MCVCCLFSSIFILRSSHSIQTVSGTIFLCLKMDISDLSWNSHTTKRKNNPLLPKSIRGIVIGKSGCGKTCLLLNLLLKEWLDYDNLCVFGKSLFQHEYEIIRKGFEEQLPRESIFKLFELRDEIQNKDMSPFSLLEQLGKEIKNKNPIKCNFYDSAKEVPDPAELNSDNKNLMIFDDLLLEKQNKCEDYYVRGRHSNVDCFYLAQNYFKLPRQTIRENANFICLFPQDLKNINHIYNDHVSIDMTKDEFRSLCKQCWSKPYGFVVIDLSSDKNNGKYRYKLDTFFIPKNGG